MAHITYIRKLLCITPQTHSHHITDIDTDTDPHPHPYTHTPTHIHLPTSWNQPNKPKKKNPTFKAESVAYTC